MIGKNNNMISLLSVLFLLTLNGCGNSGENMPVETLLSGDYEIEILAPGGEFAEGDNSIFIRVTRSGNVVDLEEGRIDLHMPQMGAMPRMDTGNALEKGTGRLEGDIFFEMDGAWQGTLELTTADGETINEPIRLRVR